MKRRFPAFVLCLLLICSIFIPISFGGNVKNIPYQPVSSNRGNILYVGGSGGDNYTKIQDAIDNASEGDTVYVYDDSSPYYENVKIYNKYYLNLIGENRDTTIIDGSGIWQKDVIILGCGVSISGFTIRNCSNYELDAGIYCQSGGNTIKGNIIINNTNGILSGTDYNIITNNIISNNDLGINIWGHKDYNYIYNNNFINNTQHVDGHDEYWDDGRYGNYWDDYKDKYPDAKECKLIPGTWNIPYEISYHEEDRHPLINQWPCLKPRTITRDIPIYDSSLLRFLDSYPILKEVILRLIR